MFTQNLKSFIKHLLNNKIYTTVTVLGFAISLTFVLLLSVYIKNELAVNQNQINKERIFRVANELYGNTPPAMGDWLQNEYSEIESYTRIYRNDEIVETDKGEKIKMNFLMADSTFFNIFTFILIEGNSIDALKTKNSIVLTQDYARRLSGNESALGKQINIKGNMSLTVTGVVEDISKTSNFRACDAIVNFRLLADLWNWPELESSFGNCSFGTYLLAKPNTNLKAKEPLMLDLFKKDFWIYKDDRVKQVILEPLTEEYFSKIPGPAKIFNSKTLIIVLSAIVIFILVLAIINYMNLTIAQSGLRVKETAIKKLIGCSRRALMLQHILESVAVCVISFIIAFLLSMFLEPFFNKLLGTNISLLAGFNIGLVISVSFTIVILGIISGLIPSIIITKLDPVEVIKGGFRSKYKGVYSRMLIGFQYIIVIVLLIATLVISKQTKFLKNKELGFNSTNTIWFDSNTNLQGNGELKNILKQVAGVQEVSFVMGSPVDAGNNQSFTYEGRPVSFQEFVVDSAFFKMMGMQIEPTGTAYSKDAIYLNKRAVKELGLEPLPKMFKRYDTNVPVIGIVNDFNYESLHTEIGPVMIRQFGEGDYVWNILVKIEGNEVSPIVDNIGKAYAGFTGGAPFEPHFMDDTIESWYTREKQTSKIVGYFTILTIVIAAMGIFAMSIFYMQQKVKEIGVRKVNGAKVIEVMQMLNKDFITWVIIAFFIASPISYFIMHKWLQNFAYKTEMSWWVFALSGIIALVIALLTVSWQTMLAATRNPVEALRYE